MTDYSQSCSRIYRLSAHFTIVSITSIIHMLTSPPSLYTLSLTILLSLVVSTFFISLHPDAAEALQVLYLLDQELMQRKGGSVQQRRKRHGER